MEIFSLFVALIISTIITPVVIKIANRKGWVVQPRKDRWHNKPTALMGGIAIFFSFISSVSICGINHFELIYVMAGMCIMFLTGLIDDLYELKPAIKLVGQVLAGLLLIYNGYIFGNGFFEWVGIPLTFFWVIGITNAINLLDNMDGLSSGISAIIAVFCGIIFFINGDSLNTIIALSLAGACLGFLVYNFNPAKIFMGDSGSLFLGYTVSYLSISLQKNASSMPSILIILLPITLMAIPIMDTTLVTIKRVFAGRKISQGGRDHTSHRLVALGLSEKKSVLILYFICIIWGLAGLLSYRLDVASSLMILLLVAFFTIIFSITLSSVKVYNESEEQLSNMRFKGQTIDNLFLLRFLLMNKKIILGIILDICIVSLSFFIASEITNQSFERGYLVLAAIVFVRVLFFFIFNLYNRLWRYISTNELVSQFASVFISSIAISFILLYYKLPADSFPDFLLIDFFITLSGVVFSRISYRFIRESLGYFSFKAKRKVLIYGAGDAGNLLLKELISNPKHEMVVVGWIDDDDSKKNMFFGGVKVFGGEQLLEKVIDKTGAKLLVVSSTNFEKEKLDRIQNICTKKQIKFGLFRMHFDW